MVRGKNVIEFEMFFSSDQIDFEKPVVVTFQSIQDQNNKLVPGEKFVAFNKKIKKDPSVLLRGFKEFRDRSLLFDAKINVLAQKNVQFASAP